MTIKKLFALSLAGIMVFSMPVLAAPSPVVPTEEEIFAKELEEYYAKTFGTSSFGNDKGSEAAALAAQASGIPMATSIAATGENKTVGEYMNNAVTEVPGLSEATPVGQGGHVMINGAPSNQTFSVQKPILAEVNSAKSQASTLGGSVLNVAKVDASVSFNTATVNFYMPGVTSSQNIVVYQLKDGQWESVTVSEVREDHVVVDMTSLGTLAFIEVPAK